MSKLRVCEIFESLQGEGYWTGLPMTFIRLAGCNAPELGLGCVDWCDTPESWDRAGGQEMESGEVMRLVRLPRLCVTGGEPLLQVDSLRDLVVEARSQAVRVHLETNGTIGLPRHVGCHFDWVVVSPKPPDYVIAPEWVGCVDELKLVVDPELDGITVERLAAAHPEAVVFLQPESVQDPTGGLRLGENDPYRKSCTRALALVMEHPDWRLSLQIHKILGIR